MTDAIPIPPDVFADAVGRLDRAEFTAFVGALQRGMTAAAVEVDPPVVTVADGDSRTRLLVGPTDAAETADTDAVDVVVHPDDDPDLDSDRSGLTPDDLREQLLYGLAPEEAASVCQEFLGTAARSPSYASVPSGSTPTAESSEESRVARGPTAGPSTPSGSRTALPDPTPPATTEGSHGAVSSGDRSPSATDPDGSMVGFGVLGPRRAVAIALVVLVAVGGAASVSNLPSDAMAGVVPGSAERAGDTARLNGTTAADPPTATQPTLEHTPSTGAGTDRAAVDSGATDGERDAPGTPANLVPEDVTAGDGTLLSERERNVRPAPTCNRSFLLVTQIQMNALRYTDNGTTEGIRTVRRFASPANRRTVDSFRELVEIIRGPTYSAMLSYDSVRYEPERTGEDNAEVGVVTRENGTVTGRYRFYLRKVDRGQRSGCWLTDAVLTE